MTKSRTQLQACIPRTVACHHRLSASEERIGWRPALVAIRRIAEATRLSVCSEISKASSTSIPR
jgi:hypothetical protein